jgi:hypothetical protein
MQLQYLNLDYCRHITEEGLNTFPNLERVTTIR